MATGKRFLNPRWLDCSPPKTALIPELVFEWQNWFFLRLSPWWPTSAKLNDTSVDVKALPNKFNEMVRKTSSVETAQICHVWKQHGQKEMICSLSQHTQRKHPLTSCDAPTLFQVQCWHEPQATIPSWQMKRKRCKCSSPRQWNHQSKLALNKMFGLMRWVANLRHNKKRLSLRLLDQDTCWPQGCVNHDNGQPQ